MAIIRTFVRLRNMLVTHKDRARRVGKHDKDIAVLYEYLRKLLEPHKTLQTTDRLLWSSTTRITRSYVFNSQRWCSHFEGTELRKALQAGKRQEIEFKVISYSMLLTLNYAQKLILTRVAILTPWPWLIAGFYLVMVFLRFASQCASGFHFP
jgi:hypothetical protein